MINTLLNLHNHGRGICHIPIIENILCMCTPEICLFHYNIIIPIQGIVQLKCGSHDYGHIYYLVLGAGLFKRSFLDNIV